MADDTSGPGNPLPRPKSGTLPVGCTQMPCKKVATVTLLIGGPYRKHEKDMPYGHVALRVVNEGSDHTYDYGRYGQTWGIGDSKGEGMLRVWTDFSKYIAGENSTGRTTTGYTFTVTPEEAKRVDDHFSGKIAGLSPNQDRGYMKQYRLADDYDALGSNCTTLSVEGAKEAIPNVDATASSFNNGRGLGLTDKMAARVKGWPTHIFMPADLGAMLSGMSGSDKPSTTTYGGGGQ
jgi:hypothetical protein